MSDDRTGGGFGGGAAPADEASTRNLLNVARGAKGIALLCFLLPWVTVSCAGQPLVRMTGVGLATGDVELVAGRGLLSGAGAENPAAGLAQSAQPDIMVILAAMLIVTGLALTFVKPLRTGVAAGMAAAVAAAVLLAFDVLVRIKGGAEARIAEGMNKNAPPASGGGGFEREMQRNMERIAEAITIDVRIGFWLTLAALVAAAVLLKVVHGRRRAAP